MLKARLSLSDLAEPPMAEGDRLRVGKGCIEPFSHAALEFFCVTTADQWFCVVRERIVGRAPPTEIEGMSWSRYADLYRECLIWSLDYVLIEVSSISRRLEVRSGPLGSAPMYASASSGALTLDWDFSRMLRASRAIDFELAARFLTLETFYSSRQICIGMSLLTERSVLSFSEHGITFWYPRITELAAEAPDSLDHAELGRTFGQYLEQAIALRNWVPGRTAVELSGGMDSAAATIAACNLLGPLRSLGILVEQPLGLAQKDRRGALIRHLGLQDFEIDISCFLPNLDLDAVDEHPAHPVSEFYREAFEAMWSSVSDLQQCSLITGIGGDEAISAGRQESATQKPVLPDTKPGGFSSWILTSRAKQAVAACSLYDAPSGPLASSVLLANAARAPGLLRHQIWPVNPLADPQLSAFCQLLPPSAFVNRVILRDYINRQVQFELFQDGYAKETFRHVLPQLISRQHATILKQLSTCCLSDLGLVDHASVISLLERSASTLDYEASSVLAVFLWLEKFSRQIGR